jgi:hypothetical protein
VTLCAWPRHPAAERAGAGYGYDHGRATPREEPTERLGPCFTKHGNDVVWNGAQWFCTLCNRSLAELIDFYSAQPYEYVSHVVRVPKVPDRFYAEQTAMWRKAAVTNSPFGRLRARVDRWREDGPPVDFNGQTRRRTQAY